MSKLGIKKTNRDGVEATTGGLGNFYCERSIKINCGYCNGKCRPGGCNCQACQELDHANDIPPFRHINFSHILSKVKIPWFPYLLLIFSAVLLGLIISSQSQLENCSKSIFPLLTFYHVAAILWSPFSNPGKYTAVEINSSIFVKLMFSIGQNVPGWIGAVGLSYMIDIEENSPSCFDDGNYPKGLAWAIIGLSLILTAFVYVSVNLGLVIYFLSAVFRFAFWILRSTIGVFRRKSEVHEAQGPKNKNPDTLVNLIRRELKRRDLNIDDFSRWSIFVRTAPLDHDVGLKEGFIGEPLIPKSFIKEKIEKEEVVSAIPNERDPLKENGKVLSVEDVGPEDLDWDVELFHLYKTKFTVPCTLQKSESLNELIEELLNLSHEQLSHPMITALVNHYWRDGNIIILVGALIEFNECLALTAIVLMQERLIYAAIYTIGPLLFVNFIRYCSYLERGEIFNSVEIFLKLPLIVSLVFYFIITNIIEVEFDSYIYIFVSGFMLLMVWWSFLYTLAMVDSIRQFMILLTEIYRSIVPFMTILFSAILGFTFAFFQYDRNQINSNTNNPNTFGHSLYGSLSLTLGGFDLSSDEPFQIHYILTAFGAIFLNVIMLNILVALMGKIQDDLLEKEEGVKNKIVLNYLRELMILPFLGARMIYGEVPEAELYWYQEEMIETKKESSEKAVTSKANLDLNVNYEARLNNLEKKIDSILKILQNNQNQPR